MSANSDDKGMFDSPESRGWVRKVLYALCAITLGADFVVKRYVDHPWEALPGFYALYGFVACVILVLVAKEMRKLLMRGEDYYDG